MTEWEPIRARPMSRRPPQNIEAEQSLLGALLIDPKCRDRISWLRSDDFWRETHANIFDAIGSLGDQADVITVADWFAKRQMSGQIENGAYLTEMAADTPGTSNVLTWARMIQQAANQRLMIQSAEAAIERAMNGAPVDDICESLSSDIGAMTIKGTTGPRTMAQVAAQWMGELEERMGKTPIQTGLADVDRIMLGMLPSDLIILAGRPKMGKTAGVMTILNNITANDWALAFSLEMSGAQLVKRSITGPDIDGARLRDPSTLEESDWPRITAAMVRAKRQKLLIDDTAGISMNQLAARAREAKRRHDVKLIAVDYLQLVTCQAENRFQEVSQISRQLKKLAKDLDVPVLALSQLSRGVEDRNDKRPRMSDLRESGQLEQDADQIWMLYRHGAYDQNDKSGITEWINVAHRDGENGTAYCKFHGAQSKYVNADSSAIAEYLAQFREQPQRKSNWQRREA